MLGQLRSPHRESGSPQVAILRGTRQCGSLKWGSAQCKEVRGGSMYPKCAQRPSPVVQPTHQQKQNFHKKAKAKSWFNRATTCLGCDLREAVSDQRTCPEQMPQVTPPHPPSRGPGIEDQGVNTSFAGQTNRVDHVAPNTQTP